MHLSIRNDVSEIAKLRESIQSFCDQNRLNQDIVFALDLCLEELLTNIIFYGYADHRKHVIELSLFLEQDFVVLQIKDDGVPFDPTRIPEPNLDVPLEERQMGGLGIHLVRNYMDSMEYERQGSFNVLTLKKKV